VGIGAARDRGADAVLLVNSDAIVPPDCVGLMEECLDRSPRTGIVGPMLRSRSTPEMIASMGMTYDNSTGRMRHRQAGDRLPAARHAPTEAIDGVSGCVMLIRREVLDAIGLLDEQYFFSFEDLDFCLRARQAGFDTIIAGQATAYHEGSQSIGADSPRRLYFAARNHLLMANRVDPRAGMLHRTGRALSIVGLNLAHAMLSSPGGTTMSRIAAVIRGTSDHLAGRYGNDR
jgi:GT2 family glycosyltransferase